MLKELGFKSRPELTLAIDETWEPTPDVCGVLGLEEDPYPIQRCCGGYRSPVTDAWYWDPESGSLVQSKKVYRFHSLPVEISQDEVFRRLDAELQPL